MKTLIISSSFSPSSHSRQMCRMVQDRLVAEPELAVEFIDLNELDLRPCHKGRSADMEALTEKTRAADAFVFGMGVHCYTVNDGLKIFLDTCLPEADHKLFGIVCAAGGDRSYLSTMHLTQICMNEWRMIQLPRVVYATGADFKNHQLKSDGVVLRIAQFSSEFAEVGRRLKGVGQQLAIQAV